jgi:hypothetical protein
MIWKIKAIERVLEIVRLDSLSGLSFLFSRLLLANKRRYELHDFILLTATGNGLRRLPPMIQLFSFMMRAAN